MAATSSTPERRMGYGELMKVAAYQAPLLPGGPIQALELIHERVRECERDEISVLCCPEAILGGLADNRQDQAQFAMRSDDGHISSVLAPLASDTVTSIV